MNYFIFTNVEHEKGDEVITPSFCNTAQNKSMWSMSLRNINLMLIDCIPTQNLTDCNAYGQKIEK